MSGSASLPRFRKRSSLRQPHLPHQLSKPWVGAYGVEHEVSLQTYQLRIALLISRVEPLESLIFVPQVGIQGSNQVRRDVASFTLACRVSMPLMRAPFQPAERSPCSIAEAA